MKYLALFVFLLNLTPAAALTPQQSGIARWSRDYIHFFCSIIPTGDKEECLRLAFENTDQALATLSENPSLNELREIATAFIRNENFKPFVSRFLFDGSPESILRQRIWKDYSVLVLPGGIRSTAGTAKKNHTTVTGHWSLEDLELLAESYKVLHQAISNGMGSDRVSSFSHIWGFGGTVARLGQTSIKGQFGEVWNNHPFQVNIVVDLGKTNFKPDLIAERIAHENSHSNDHLIGNFLTDKYVRWTHTEHPKIFDLCSVPVNEDSSLVQCHRDHPSWFSFHPTSIDGSNYAASNPKEFYGKMLDLWVRENLNPQRSKYRCQNPRTAALWAEMEKTFIGDFTSPSCEQN